MKSRFAFGAIATTWLACGVALPAFAQDDLPATDSGATAWMLTSTALVLLMIPGLAMFYGGLVRTKNVLGTMMHSFVAMGIMTILWVVCGYSMSFGPSVLGGWIGWDSDLVLLRALDDPARLVGSVPEYVFAMFQGKFAIITPALIAGAFAERVKFKSYCIFIAIWGLVVYNPLCHWVWHEDGFLYKMGAIDFAGGTVVHISSGVSALVAVLFIGRRRGQGSMQPNNLTMTLIGAGLLWVGWFGFNAGSSVASNFDTARALTVTQVAAAAGALTWILIEAVHLGKPSALGFASGILAGLVAVTPAAGVVLVEGALVLGVVAAFICYGAILMKGKLGYDDTLDVFGIHGVGGIVGALLLSFFIREASQTGTAMEQLGIQLAAVGTAIGYAAGVTLVLVLALEKTIGFRSPPEDEMAGIDTAVHGESGYGLLTPN